MMAGDNLTKVAAPPTPAQTPAKPAVAPASPPTPNKFTRDIIVRVTEHIKRELRRRSAVEPVIGHTKGEHRMGRNYLAGQQSDANQRRPGRRRIQLQNAASLAGAIAIRIPVRDGASARFSRFTKSVRRRLICILHMA
jgi:hypothetical protein